MKKILIFLLIPHLFSCNKNTEKGVIPKYSVTIEDTVILNADRDNYFIYLNENLRLSYYSSIENIFFNYNPKQLRLEILNLEKYELDDLIKFELEGPNSISEFILSMDYETSMKYLLLGGYEKVAILDSNFRKINDFSLMPGRFVGDSVPVASSLSKILYSEPYSDDYHVLFSDFFNNITTFGTYNSTSNSFKKINLPDSLMLDKYFISLKNSEDIIIAAKNSNPSIQILNGSIYISSTSSNAIGLYNLSKDKIEVITPKSNTIPKNKRDIIISEHLEPNNFLNALVDFYSDVNYGTLIYNSELQLFHRFTYFFENDINNPDREFLSPSKIFLVTYDKDFNLISEVLLPNFNTPPLISIIDGQNFKLLFKNNDELNIVIAKLFKDE